MEPIKTLCLSGSPRRGVRFSKATNEVLLAIEELTGISFRCWRDNDGIFQVETHVGNTRIFFFEDGCLRFSSVCGKDQDTVERDMARTIMGGVLATKIWKDDPDTWQIPKFSDIRELGMKASLIGGENPFKTA